GKTCTMRNCAKNIEDVKAYVSNLCGRNLRISVNKGRKKIVKYNGSILAVYPQVFTLKITDVKNMDLLSCSYNDVICGDIKLSEIK
ncbi:MAG: Veg family protein, partial [Clostridia bacterium]|nr:Veg family protein [Clostridia bacterium]